MGASWRGGAAALSLPGLRARPGRRRPAAAVLRLVLALSCVAPSAGVLGKAAVIGDECTKSEFARMSCRAVERSKVRYPLDNIEFISVRPNVCDVWMIGTSDQYRSVIMVGPQLMPCLEKHHRAHPNTQFMTVDFCPPAASSASNVVCGNFRSQLPSLTAGYPGYLPGYPTGVASEAKVELICSVIDRELARIRAL
mmetsp:Transcript_28057/g.63548  ORF Transcript_28057/g.63548 Transcript_28057/m.63548 type:complete len:196 (+) Transcript_28057:76-663(+)